MNKELNDIDSRLIELINIKGKFNKNGLFQEYDFHPQTLKLFNEIKDKREKIDEIVNLYSSKTNAKPKKLYRGVSDDIDEDGFNGGGDVEGIGLYTTTNKKLAEQYTGENGRVIEMDISEDIPKNPIFFRDTNMFEICFDQIFRKVAGFKRKDEYSQIPLNELVNFIGSEFDGIQIGKGSKAIFCQYPDIKEIRNLKEKEIDLNELLSESSIEKINKGLFIEKLESLLNTSNEKNNTVNKNKDVKI